MSIKFLSVRTNFLLTLVLVTAIFAGACVQQPDNRASEPGTNETANANTIVNTNVNVSNSVAPQTETASTAALNTPVTMPVLDAVLTDESFINEAKTSLQITDEQMQKLAAASRNAVLNLNQAGSSDDNRSTKSSVENAKTQIYEAIGQEKGDRLIAMVQQRWAGDGAGEMSANPNSIPTDTRIVVNAPAYRMDIFKEGKLTKSYKIGIGYPEFPLPTGLRKASTIIFNPTWTPPDEPWVKGKVKPGKKVEAGSKLNPLGPIKIPIGLPSLIHGGKSPDRIGTFASHGCVGLTNPQVQDFAMEISNLSSKPMTMQDIKGYEKTKSETKEVKLDAAIPVELRYETIVVEDGKLKIYRDVYERGTNTEENLTRVLETFGVSVNNLPAADREKILAGLEMMAMDAEGSPVESHANANTNMTSSNSAKSGKNSNSGDGKVTRKIKGKKELIFEIAELKGKGYPAAVNMK